jgi:hypothetical protein
MESTSKPQKGKKVSKNQDDSSADEGINLHSGFYEMNIRVGSEQQINENVPFGRLLKDPIVVKYLQEMAVSSINGKL